MTALEVPTLSPLALDLASGYFSDQEIARRHGMTPRQLEQRKRNPALRKEVSEIERQLNDNGAEIRLVARQYAAQAVKVLAELMNDVEVPSSTREKAATRVLFFAGATPVKENAAEPTAPVLVINTNLRLEDTHDEREIQGEYVLKAIEHDTGDDLL